MENLKQLKEEVLRLATDVDPKSKEWDVLAKINGIIDDEIMKIYNYVVTFEDGSSEEGEIVAERKLTANVLVTKRFVEKGHYDFKVNIK